MTKILLILLGVILILIFSPQIQRGILAVFVMHDLFPQVQTKWLSYVSKDPILEHPQIAVGEEKIEANLYRPNDGKKHSAFVYVHGVNELGKDDPRLVSLAETFSRAGFTVLVPGLPDMSPGKLNPKVIDEIEASLRYIAGRKDIIQGEKIGVLGFSIGSGPAMIAASRLDNAGRIKFLMSFGGYFDLREVIKFSTTGHFAYQEQDHFFEPDPESRWFFVRYYSDFIENQNDANLLKQIAEMKIADPQKDISGLREQLSAEGNSILDLIENTDPAAVDTLIGGLPQKLQNFIRELNPAEQNIKLATDIFLVHSVNDNVVPYTESLELNDYFKTRTRTELFLIKIFSHVNPVFPPLNLNTFFKEYIPEAYRFWKLIYEVLDYRT